ncbi:MAG: hypothetical protein DRO06_02955 [Thermoproteota archaeon]|nr:MAG: hypothetical protein DRO06_02955 [Candidatus Korarchaeota archaeon]
MLDPLEIFEVFRPEAERPPLSRTHPLTRTVCVAVLIAMPLIKGEFWWQVLSLACAAPFVAASGGARKPLKSARAAGPLIALIVFVNAIVTGDVWFSAGMGVRFVALILSAAAYMASTDPAELGDLLQMVRIPQSVGISFTIAVRFIPVLASDIQNIAAAQASRGHRLDAGGFIERARRAIPILVPAIVAAIRRSESLAESLESRCFGSGRRTSFVEYQVGRGDTLLILYLAALAAAVWWGCVR